MCLRRGLHEATLHATRNQVQSPAENELAMSITRRNEKDGQSASRALVLHSTSQRFFFLNQQSEYKVFCIG